MSSRCHDQMETFQHYWPFVRGIHRSPVDSPQKGQWREALIFSLICAWINAWVNNRDAGDLRRHRAHYDVAVMKRSGERLTYCGFGAGQNVLCLIGNGNVVILTQFSSLTAPEVVILATSVVASGENLVKMTTFLFACPTPSTFFLAFWFLLPPHVLQNMCIRK